MTGVSEAGLRTTLFPAISAGASLRAGVSSGSFQGVMASTTPRGSCTVQDITSGFSWESRLPRSARPSPP